MKATAWRGSSSLHAGTEVGEKTTPSRTETRGGRGRRPLGLGGARPTRMRGAESTGQPERERKEGYPGLDTLRKQEANEGSSARSTRVDPGASQTGLGVLKTLAQV